MKVGKIMYAAGPGDVVNTFRHWEVGIDDPSQFSVTYSGQFYDTCKKLNLNGVVISSNPRKDKICTDRFVIKNSPLLFRSKDVRGMLYTLLHIYNGLVIVFNALRYRVDTLIVADGTSYWFVFSILKLFKIKFIPTMHCVLWPPFKNINKKQKMLLKLSSYTLQKHTKSILVVSEDIRNQVIELTEKKDNIYISSLPKYRKTAFQNIKSANWNSQNFVVLFVGRIEINKGVTDLLDIAKKFQDIKNNRIKFHICGEGSALTLIENKINEMSLQQSVKLLGHCTKEKLAEQYNLANCVIVPTRTSFIEGLNKVVIEGVLAARPIVTSKVCPAMNLVTEAVVEVQADSVDSYYQAILKLLTDEVFYKSKIKGCIHNQDKLLQNNVSWSENLSNVLKI